MVKKEDFEDWLENPVTVQFREAMLAYSKWWLDSWMSDVWDAPSLSAEKQIELNLKKARSIVSKNIAEWTYGEIVSFTSKEQE